MSIPLSTLRGLSWTHLPMYQPPKYCFDHPESSQCAIYGGFGGKVWFFITFSTSIITGSLGVTKFLQTGPCSMLSEEGTLGGLLRWKFIIAYLAVMTSMVTKALFIAIFVLHIDEPGFYTVFVSEYYSYQCLLLLHKKIGGMKWLLRKAK